MHPRWPMNSPEKKRILIADPSSITIREIFRSPFAQHYDIQTVYNGPECIEKIESFRPHLLFIELLLPKMHGIEILKVLKTDLHYQSIGVIISSSLRMIQNYNAAIELGAIYFLMKPFSNEEFFNLVHKFFDGTLSPAPFNHEMPHFELGNCYNPIVST